MILISGRSDLIWIPLRKLPVAIVELWRKNKIISIEVKLGELPEESFVERTKNNEEIDKEIFTLKNLDLSIKDSKQNFGVIVTSVNPNSNLQEGDIIKEVTSATETV